MDREADYGIERLPNGNVEIRLGHIPPFEVTPDAALKMAAILLKKAGCDVKLGGGKIVAHCPITKDLESAVRAASPKPVH